MENTIKDINQDKVNKFMSLKPHKWFTIKKHSFYECPIYGSDEGLIIKTPNNELFVTDLFDANTDDLKDLIENGDFAEYYSEWNANNADLPEFLAEMQIS